MLNAFSQSYWFNPSLPDAPLQYSNRYPLNFGVALTPQNGIGTIGSVTNWQLTGAGTAFTKQLQPGTIINDNHGHSGRRRLGGIGHGCQFELGDRKT